MSGGTAVLVVQFYQALGWMPNTWILILQYCTSVDQRYHLHRLSPRQNRYCFWYYRKGAQKESRDPSEAYESGIKVVDSFQTVEHFWRIYNHMLRADQVLCMFRPPKYLIVLLLETRKHWLDII